MAQSSATIQIDVDVALSDLRTTLDGHQLLEPDVGVVLDTPLRQATIDVSASS